MRGFWCVLALTRSLGAQTVDVLVGGEAERNGGLGDVRHVLVLPRQFVVLERQAPVLHVFGPDGRRLQTLGRAGRGPGEYTAAASLAFDPVTGSVLVFDPATSRLTRYSVSDTLILRGIERIEATGVSVGCVAGERMLAPTLDSLLVHDFRLRGGVWTPQHGYGRKGSRHPLAAHPLLRQRLGGGPLVCSRSLDTVVVASRELGEVIWWSREDTTGRVLSLPGAVLAEFAPEGRGLRTSEPPRGWYEQVQGVVLAGGTFHVTVARLGRRAEGAGAAYRELEGIAERIPDRVRAQAWQMVGFHDGRAVCYQTAPVPALGKASGRSCP